VDAHGAQLPALRADAMSSKVEVPPDYAAAVGRAVGVLRAYRRAHPMARPSFRLGQREILIAAELRTLAKRICKNDDAADVLLDILIAVPQCTVFMFGVALELDGAYPIERVPLRDLGIEGVGQS
jgi:hypothetical protein